MPTYAYACTECRHEFDAVQSFSDDALTDCPRCGGQLRKKFGSVGVVFKGGGFYKTDSRGPEGGSKGSTKGTGTDGSAGDGTTSGSDSSSAGSTSAAASSSGASSSDGTTGTSTNGAARTTTAGTSSGAGSTSGAS